MDTQKPAKCKSQTFIKEQYSSGVIVPLCKENIKLCLGGDDFDYDSIKSMAGALFTSPGASRSSARSYTAPHCYWLSKTTKYEHKVKFLNELINAREEFPQKLEETCEKTRKTCYKEARARVHYFGRETSLLEGLKNVITGKSRLPEIKAYAKALKQQIRTEVEKIRQEEIDNFLKREKGVIAYSNGEYSYECPSQSDDYRDISGLQKVLKLTTELELPKSVEGESLHHDLEMERIRWRDYMERAKEIQARYEEKERQLRAA